MIKANKLITGLTLLIAACFLSLPIVSYACGCGCKQHTTHSKAYCSKHCKNHSNKNCSSKCTHNRG